MPPRAASVQLKAILWRKGQIQVITANSKKLGCGDIKKTLYVPTCDLYDPVCSLEERNTFMELTIFVFLKKYILQVPGWLSQISGRLLLLAQVMI